jgi:hypothetical protein
MPSNEEWREEKVRWLVAVIGLDRMCDLNDCRMTADRCSHGGGGGVILIALNLTQIPTLSPPRGFATNPAPPQTAVGGTHQRRWAVPTNHQRWFAAERAPFF